MSDLIDRKKAIEAIKQFKYTDRFFKSYAVDILKGQPAVESIPIEWIEQYGRENWYDFGTQYNAITEMIKAWRKKNGQTD